MSGASTAICRSKRPGRSSAGSRMSGRLVAAMRMTLVLTSKPSISTSSWLRVCSRSSWPPPRPAPRWRPTASISSTKTMAGALALACSNRSRTRRGADTDEHLDEVRAGDRVERHARPRRRRRGRAGSCRCRAGRRAARPWGSWRRPRGTWRAPARNSLISCSSSTASSEPATSAKVTLGVSLVASLARDLPNCMTREPPPCIWPMRNQNSPTTMSSGKKRDEDRRRGALAVDLVVVRPSAGGARSSAVTTARPAGVDVVGLRPSVASLMSVAGR